MLTPLKRERKPRARSLVAWERRPTERAAVGAVGYLLVTGRALAAKHVGPAQWPFSHLALKKRSSGLCLLQSHTRAEAASSGSGTELDTGAEAPNFLFVHLERFFVCARTCACPRKSIG